LSSSDGTAEFACATPFSLSYFSYFLGDFGGGLPAAATSFLGGGGVSSSDESEELISSS